MTFDAEELLAILREEGSDTAFIEAKKASEGYPSGLEKTLSAFSNMPGGGVIVFGVREELGGEGGSDFSVVGVYDAADAQQRLAAQARKALSPPLRLTTGIEKLEGQRVVVARVPELSSEMKPCRVKMDGKAYLRSYDGDYPLSEQETAALEATRATPRFDREPVPDSSIEDLDQELVALYVGRCRARSPRLSALANEEILRQTRVVAPDGRLTVAGVYALGRYPQYFFPTLSVTARLAPRASDPPGTRSGDIAHFDGPLTELLTQTMAWVSRNTGTRVRFGTDGHGRDEPAYPAEAVRELVANALIHRDLGPHALGDRVHVVLKEDRLILTNPGGLYGVTVEQLGVRVGGSARNQSLYDIAKDLRTPDGRRVIEGVGSGIIAASEALRDAGMTEPAFLDSAIRFSATVPQHALLDEADIRWLAHLPNAKGLTDAQRHVLATMRHGKEWTNRSLRDFLPMDSTKARQLLTDLTDRALAVAEGEGRGRRYRLADSFADSFAQETPTPIIRTRAAAGPKLYRTQQIVFDALDPGGATRAELVELLDLTNRQVSHSLKRLDEAGLVVMAGAQGHRHTRYKRASIEEPEESN